MENRLEIHTFRATPTIASKSEGTVADNNSSRSTRVTHIHGGDHMLRDLAIWLAVSRWTTIAARRTSGSCYAGAAVIAQAPCPWNLPPVGLALYNLACP